MAQSTIDDVLINEWESFHSFENSTSRGSSPGHYDSRSPLDHTPGVQPGRQYIAASNNKRQALEHVTSYKNEQIPISLERTAYGTNEDVYNPYQPYTSREYIAQEIAAGRMSPAETAQELPCDSLNLSGSFPGSFSRPSNEIKQSLNAGSTIWTSEADTARLEAALALTTETNTGALRLGDSLDFPSHHRHLYPFMDEDLDESEPGSYTGDHLRSLYSPENSSLSPDEPTASYSSLPSSSQHRVISEQTRASSRLKETLEKTRRKVRRPCLMSTDMQTFNGSADRKRRRADRSPEDAVISRRTRGLSAGHCPAFATSAMPSTGNSSGLQDQADFYVEARMSSYQEGEWSNCAIVGSWQDLLVLPQNLLQLVGLISGQYSSVHSSTLGSSATSASMPVVSPYVFDSSSRVFTSECIPQSFSPQRRQDLLNIFWTKAPYVPACTLRVRDVVNIQYHVADSLEAFQPTSDRLKPPQPGLGRNGRGWPSDLIPLELLQQVVSYLPHADLKSMRLVNKEFERKTSGYMFKSVVVPFGPEIYEMAMKDKKSPTTVDEKSSLVARFKRGWLLPQSKAWKFFDIKGKGKQEVVFQQNHTVQRSHDGMEIFNAWGRHVKKFAMVFEIQHDQLARPLVKGNYVHCPTWWGPYRWPFRDYPRYDYCSGLEKKADEYPRMCYALSKLVEVKELGLCIDSGLGWLPGPDLSDRALIFQRKSKIFGCREAEENGQNEKRQKTWDNLIGSVGPQLPIDSVLQSDRPSGPLPSALAPVAPILMVPNNSLNFNRAYTHYSLERRPLIFEGTNISNDSPGCSITSVDLRNLSQGAASTRFENGLIVPNQLTKAQKEWLMEIQWAQEAFMTSYCLAIIDNRHTFKNVHSLNIAKLSSKLVSNLQRKDIWESLPALSSVTIIVAADFRVIQSDGPSEVQLIDVPPSHAVKLFFTLLKTYLAEVKSIKTMTIGYFGGGEHQTGIFGRNRFVLPAPLADYSNETVFTNDHKETLYLPYVENLTLKNCWIAPPILKNLVVIMDSANLCSLNLESVSLTAHAGVSNPIQPNAFEDGLSRHLHSGQRRMNDPHIPDSFYSQRSLGSDPGLDDAIDWIYSPTRVGSWADVLDTISPGPTLNFVRYAFQYCDQVPPVRNPGKLEAINFVSCGYVRLVNQTSFDQSSIPEESHRLSRALYSRAIDLMPVMMHRHRDQLLGQIVPSYNELDLSVFNTGFPMTLGWGDDESKYDNIEDARPEGGSGRFTGRLEKLVR